MPNCYIIIHKFFQYCHIGMFVTTFGQNVIPFFVVRSEITLQQCCPLSIFYKFLNCTSINFHLLIVIDILLTAIKQRRFRTVIHLHHHLHFSHLNVSLNHFDVPTIFFKHNIFTFIIFYFQTHQPICFTPLQYPRNKHLIRFALSLPIFSSKTIACTIFLITCTYAMQNFLSFIFLWV